MDYRTGRTLEDILRTLKRIVGDHYIGDEKMTDLDKIHKNVEECIEELEKILKQ